MEIPAEALAVADADPAVAPVAAAVSAEVSGEPEGVSLLDAVAAGRVPHPAEMPFSEWLKSGGLEAVNVRLRARPPRAPNAPSERLET